MAEGNIPGTDNSGEYYNPSYEPYVPYYPALVYPATVPILVCPSFFEAYPLLFEIKNLLRQLLDKQDAQI